MTSFDAIPVELLYRIFDSLDAESIFLSMQYVCKRFYSIVNNYNRCKLNFKSIAKHKFHHLCRDVCPLNVNSLTLSDENQTPGQIELFLSLTNVEEYTRLQSVTLISIQEPHLTKILNHLSTVSLLTTLVIHYESIPIVSAEASSYLSSIIGKTSLRKLDLALGYDLFNKLEWPIQSSIQYLRLFSIILLDKFCTILHNSPYLKTMILRDCGIRNVEEIQRKVSAGTLYHQLTSFTLEDCDLDMKRIELCLSLTPSLMHFTLIGNTADLFDGFQWEQFIQTKLLNLNRFEFALQSYINVSHDLNGLDTIIAPFQTPFWLQTKQWFVTALCIQNSDLINLYTNKDCASKINFHPKANKISRSTSSTTVDNVVIMDCVRELTLNLNEIQADKTEKKSTSNNRIFNKLIKLILRVDRSWPDDSRELLSSYIDLSTITELVLDINFTLNNISYTTAGIISLLEETSNIRSLIILNRSVIVPNICTIIPPYLQHLQIFVNSFEDMKIILDKCESLFSVTFEFISTSSISIPDIIHWLTIKGRDFKYKSNQYSLHLWLGKIKRN